MYKDSTIDSTQCHNDFALSFTPSPQRTAIPSEGEYSVSRGVGTDSNGNKFLAPADYRGSRNYQPTNKSHPCPVCDDVKGKCRVMASSDLVLCMNHQEPLSGWRFQGTSSDGLWGKFYPENENYRPVYTPDPKAEKRPEVEWSREQWDRHNRAILSKTKLTAADRADIEKRLHRAGLSVDLVSLLNAASLTYGYLIPCHDPQGNLLRGQVRYRGENIEGGRYRWQLPNDGIDGHIDGELPLGCWQPVTPQQRPIEAVLTEGTGVKPFIAAQILGVPAIGASSGNHAGSPQLLKEALGQVKTVGLGVDAGAILNRNVLGKYRRTEELLQNWGVTLLYGWWGQTTKDQEDIDEGIDPSTIQWLQPDQFWALVPSDAKPNLTAIAGGGTGKGKSKAQKRRERKEIQAREVHHAILHPWGDREVDYVAHSMDEALAYLLANPFTMIDGITAAGKTVLIAQLLQLLEEQGYSRDDFFPFTPIRSLARGAAAKFDLPYRGCIHSIAAIAPLMLKREKSVAIYDEVEQDLFALNKSKLCEANRLYKIELHERAILRSDRIILASATANIKDVAYFEKVKGERFKIMRYAPAIPSKGELTMYTGDSAVKGSQKFARAKVEAMATTKSYVAADSLRKAIEMEQRLTEGLQPGDIAPILACSRTGDDDLVQAITRSTNGGQVLADLGCPGVIATSFIQSGVSFQNPEGGQLFDLAVGTYGGHTISPADAFQQIERPRMAIPRHIFAPSYAKPPQRLARSAARWDSDVAALEDATAIGAFKDFKYASGAVKDWCKAWEAQMQLEYSNYAVAYAAYAERNGYQVKWEVCTDEAEIQDYRDDVDRAMATPIVIAHRLDYHQFRSLMEKPEPTIAEQDEIEAYLIREYYGLDWDAPLTVDQVISEGFGKGRKALKAALRATFAGTAADDDRKQREKLGDGGFIWDTTAYELEQIWADRIGLDEVLAYCLSNPRGIQVPQIREFADRLAAVQDQIGEGSKIFGHKIPWRVLGQEEQHYGEVMKWIGMVLKNKFGVASTSTRHRTPEGITTVYQCNQDDVDRLKAAVGRKAESQIEKGFYPRSTPLAKAFYGGVDRAYPTAELWGNTWYVGTREGKTWHCPIGLDPADPQNWMSFAA